MKRATHFISVTWSLVVFSTIAMEVAAQSQVTGLEHPVAVVMQASTTHAFIVEQGSRRLLRWTGEGSQAETVVEDLSSEPASLEQIVSLTIRDGDKVCIVGTSNGTPRLVTYNVGDKNSAEFEDGLSGDLNLGDAENISAIASTGRAIYLATNSKGEGTLWRIETGTSSFGKPIPIYSDKGLAITSLAVSLQGHLAETWSSPGQNAQLRFHDAKTGQQLLSVPTDAQAVSSLTYSQSGLIYGSCTKSDRRGVYRFDVFFDGSKQAVRVIEVAQLDNLIGIACAGTKESVALVGGKSDGRALWLQLK